VRKKNEKEEEDDEALQAILNKEHAKIVLFALYKAFFFKMIY
jgi:hypothetical protein